MAAWEWGNGSLGMRFIKWQPGNEVYKVAAWEWGNGSVYENVAVATSK